MLILVPSAFVAIALFADEQQSPAPQDEYRDLFRRKIRFQAPAVATRPETGEIISKPVASAEEGDEAKHLEHFSGHPLANVFDLSLEEAVEAARAKFSRQPAVLEIEKGDQTILITIDPDNTDPLLIPPIWYGWPIELR